MKRRRPTAEYSSQHQKDGSRQPERVVVGGGGQKQIKPTRNDINIWHFPLSRTLLKHNVSEAKSASGIRIKKNMKTISSSANLYQRTEVKEREIDKRENHIYIQPLFAPGGPRFKRASGVFVRYLSKVAICHRLLTSKDTLYLTFARLQRGHRSRQNKSIRNFTSPVTF
jgi:hypothetical protein